MHIAPNPNDQEFRILSATTEQINALQPVNTAVGMNTVGTTECNFTGIPSDLIQKLIRAWRAIGQAKSEIKLVGFVKKYTIIPTIKNSDQVVHTNLLDSSTLNLFVFMTFSFFSLTFYFFLDYIYFIINVNTKNFTIQSA